MSKLLQFIKDNKEWKALLELSPYNLKIREKGNLCLFMYKQTESDFNNEIVLLSRGSIVDIVTGEYVCRPYDKFFNIGESKAADIDMKSARFYEKLDGSIIKLYNYNNEWIFATNGMIDANDADINDMTFMDVIKLTEEYKNIKYNNLPKENTYIFELCSRYNKVVIDYPNPKLVLTGVRNNKTGEYLNNDIQAEFGITNIVREYAISDVIDIPKENIEGCVLKDKDYKMVKCKNKWYIVAHNMNNNGDIEKGLENLYISNERDEYLSYFPERKEQVDEYFNRMNEKLDIIYKNIEYINSLKIDELLLSYKERKKRLASEINKLLYGKFLFCLTSQTSVELQTPVVEQVKEYIVKNY